MPNEGKQATIIKDLTVGSVSKTLAIFAMPMVFANLLQTAYNMVDMVVVGQFLGSVGLSAVSIGAAMLHLMAYLAIGFSTASQVIISQFVGAGDKKSVSRAIGTSLSFVLLGSFLITAVILAIVDVALHLLNTPAEAYANARQYVLVCSAGLFFIFGYNLVSAILRGMGDSRRPLIFIAIAAGTNLILDLLFIAVFHMGVFGAALATVIGQAVSFITSIVFLYKKRNAFGFDFKPRSFKVDRDILRRLLKLGIPMCIQNTAIGLSMMFVSSFVNAYGVVASAVTGIGDKLAIVPAVITSSLSTSGAAMIGQCLGAGKTERIPRIIRFSLLANVAFALLLSAITVFLPLKVFGLFTSDSQVLEMALTYVACAVHTYFAFALRAPFFALIYGTGQSKLNLWVAILDGVICRIGLALLLGIVVGMGIRGFWYGSALAGYVPFFIGLVYYVSGKWKTKNLLIKS